MAIGMEMARLIRDEATAGLSQSMPAALPVAEAAAAFERVARAVRRTVRMVQWLDQPQPARADEGARRVRARKEIIRAVEDGIDREAAEGEADGLHGEMLERLDSLELDEDIAGRPVREIIRDILDDLGAAATTRGVRARRRGMADLAVLQARAEAAPGEAREVAGGRFETGRPERRMAFVRDISELTDEELDRLAGDDEDSG